MQTDVDDACVQSARAGQRRRLEQQPPAARPPRPPRVGRVGGQAGLNRPLPPAATATGGCGCGTCRSHVPGCQLLQSRRGVLRAADIRRRHRFRQRQAPKVAQHCAPAAVDVACSGTGGCRRLATEQQYAHWRRWLERHVAGAGAVSGAASTGTSREDGTWRHHRQGGMPPRVRHAAPGRLEAASSRRRFQARVQASPAPSKRGIPEPRLSGGVLARIALVRTHRVRRHTVGSADSRHCVEATRTRWAVSAAASNTGSGALRFRCRRQCPSKRQHHEKRRAHRCGQGRTQRAGSDGSIQRHRGRVDCSVRGSQQLRPLTGSRVEPPHVVRTTRQSAEW